MLRVGFFVGASEGALGGLQLFEGGDGFRALWVQDIGHGVWPARFRVLGL